VRRILPLLAAGAVTLLWLSPVQAQKKADKAETCGEFGTNVHFEKSPSDAARRAMKEEKLVMVLHISGYFEDPDFT
jgi:hypothetical protein